MILILFGVLAVLEGNMKLSNEETDLYYRLHWSLLFYVNQKYRVFEGLNEPILRQENPQKVMELYGKLFNNLGLIDSLLLKIRLTSIVKSLISSRAGKTM